MNLRNIKKKELLLIAGILIFAGVLWVGLRLAKKEHYGSVLITVNGEKYGTYSLGEDQTIKINDTNVCEISNGQVRMIEAQCPDHLCISQGAIGSTGGLIVCLPNRVIIEASAPEGEDSGVDAVIR